MNQSSASPILLSRKKPVRKVATTNTAEAFYRVFCALPKKDRLAVARYILLDEDVRQNPELADALGLKTKSFVTPDSPIDLNLEAAYRQMANDEARELEALVWAEATGVDVSPTMLKAHVAEVRFRALAAKGSRTKGLAVLDKLDDHFSKTLPKGNLN